MTTRLISADPTWLGTPPFSHATAFADGTVGAALNEKLVVTRQPYGATTAGAVDATAAFAAAYADAVSRGRSVVEVPPGDFLVSGTVFSLTSSSPRVNFIGAGSQATRLHIAPGYNPANPLINIVGISGGRVAGPLVKGFYIVGQNNNAIDPVAVKTDYTNGMTFEDVFVDGVRNTAFDIAHAWDAGLHKIRTYACGYDSAGRTMRIGQTSTDGNDNGNTIKAIDVTVERGYGRGIELQNVNLVTLVSAKIHGRRTTDSNPTDSKELLWLNGAVGTRMSESEVSECRTDSTSGAIRLTGSVKSTLAMSEVNFDKIGSDDTYAAYFDSTDSNSKLAYDLCHFNDVRSVTKYVAIASASGIGANAIRIGSSNTYLSANMEVNDTTSGAGTRMFQRALNGFMLNGASQFFSGTGAPAGSLGANGDFYFRDDGAGGSAIYLKAGGVWGAIA